MFHRRKSKIIAALAVPVVLLSANAYSQQTVVADFEELSYINNLNHWNAAYVDSRDGGNSTINNFEFMVPPDPDSGYFAVPVAGEGYDGGNCLYVDYTFGTIDPEYGSYLGVYIDCANDSETLDITGATELTFWAKASVATKMRVKLATSNISDYGYYQVLVDVPTGWTQYTIAIADLEQPSWATPVSLDLSLIEAVTLELTEEENPPDISEELWLDDIVLNGIALTNTNVTISPMNSDIGTTQNFDLMIFIKNLEGKIPTGAVITLDGSDITSIILGGMALGNLTNDDGKVIQFPDISGSVLGAPGEHVFSAKINFNDGSSVSKTSIWNVVKVN